MHVVVAEECYHPHYRQLTPAEMSISMDNIIHTTVRLITNTHQASTLSLKTLLHVHGLFSVGVGAVLFTCPVYLLVPQRGAVSRVGVRRVQ